MTPLEIIAVVFSILCVILTIQRNIWNWGAGIIGIIAYMILFYDNKLYADMGLQVIYLGQSLYGWYYWHMHSDKAKAHKDILTLSMLQKIAVLAFILGLWLGLWAFLVHFTDGDIPKWDALATAFSLTAQGLLMWRFIENWICWIVADALLVGIFTYKALTLSAWTYALFFVMALLGWSAWRRELATQRAFAAL